MEITDEMVERAAALLSTTGRTNDWHREWARRILAAAVEGLRDHGRVALSLDKDAARWLYDEMGARPSTESESEAIWRALERSLGCFASANNQKQASE